MKAVTQCTIHTISECLLDSSSENPLSVSLFDWKNLFHGYFMAKLGFPDFGLYGC